MSGEELAEAAGAAAEVPPAAADGGVAGPARRARKQNPLASRIKRLMQADEDVGKIAQATPPLIGEVLGGLFAPWDGTHKLRCPHHARLAVPCRCCEDGAQGCLQATSCS